MMELNFDEIKHETDSAYLVLFEPGIQHWMPKSQCNLITEAILECPEWIVEEKELELYEV